jgi:hypothetical protein
VQQVEHEKRDRAALGIPARTVGRGPQPPAQARKIGTAVPAEAHELAVEQHPVAAENGPDRRQLGKLLAAVPARPRAQADGTPVTAQLEAHPVELHLERPAVADGHRPGARQHRRHKARKLLS